MNGGNKITKSVVAKEYDFGRVRSCNGLVRWMVFIRRGSWDDGHGFQMQLGFEKDSLVLEDSRLKASSPGRQALEFAGMASQGMLSCWCYGPGSS